MRLLAGDCRVLLAALAAASVQCVVTSPPYFGLRDYGTGQWDGGDPACDHVARWGGCRDNGRDRAASGGTFHDSPIPKQITQQFRDVCGKCGARRMDRQIGLEATPDAYIAEMVAVFREVRRCLREDGCAFVNMGDGYRDKQLLLMPARVALALQADGWWLRSDIIWSKPNPMPESVTDRPTSAHEHVFLLTKSARYFFDAEAVRENGTGRSAGNASPVKGSGTNGFEIRDVEWHSRNLRNVWEIATEAFHGSHFATFPTALAERCIRAGTSERGCCAQCGAPWGRATDARFVPQNDVSLPLGVRGHNGQGPMAVGNGWQGVPRGTTERTTLGWSPSCACNAGVVPQTVLDPFAGAGTTLLVADRLQRNAVGIELSAAYIALAERRIASDAPLFVTTIPPVPDAEATYDRQPDLFAAAAD
jgi:DNA modification methylase